MTDQNIPFLLQIGFYLILWSDNEEDDRLNDGAAYGYRDTSLCKASDETKQNEYRGNRGKFIAHDRTSSA